jgi:capsular polysaccharide biosynthesis protein
MEESEKKDKILEESNKPTCVSNDDDEIDLYELGMVLARRWKLIIGIFIAALIVSVAVSLFLLKPVYKSSMLIKSNADAISTANQNIKEYQEFQIFTQYINAIDSNLSSGNYVLISKQLGIPVNSVKYLSSLSVRQVKNSGLIAVTIYVHKTKGFKSLAYGIFKRINDSEYFTALSAKNKKYLFYKKAVLIKELDKTDYIINNIGMLIKGAGENGKLLPIYAHPKSFLQESSALKIELHKVNYDLKHRLYLPFSLVSKPYTPSVPFKPNKKLIVAVSGISALFFGIFLVFFLEFIEKNRNRHNNK